MVLKNRKYDKIRELFFEHPNKRFTIREISKRTRVPTSSVQRYLRDLRQEGFITKENKAIESSYNKFTKSIFIINRMFESGLVDYLENKLLPSAVIVFGSVRKGEYDHSSDIDLFVETTKKGELNLEEFERKLGHNIQIFVRKDINELPENLFNSVVNGIKLSGYFKIK